MFKMSIVESDTEGKLWIFWAKASAHAGRAWPMVEEDTLAGVWAMIIDNPELKDPKLSTLVQLADGVIYVSIMVTSYSENDLKIGTDNKKLEVLKRRLIVRDG